MTKAKDTTFAAVLAVLATAVIGEELWAWGDGLPLWIWLTSFVCALLAFGGRRRQDCQQRCRSPLSLANSESF